MRSAWYSKGQLTKQRLLRVSFPSELFRSNITLLEGDLAVLDPKGADVAITIEPLSLSSDIVLLWNVDI